MRKTHCFPHCTWGKLTVRANNGKNRQFRPYCEKGVNYVPSRCVGNAQKTRFPHEEACFLSLLGSKIDFFNPGGSKNDFSTSFPLYMRKFTSFPLLYEENSLFPSYNEENSLFPSCTMRKTHWERLNNGKKRQFRPLSKKGVNYVPSRCVGNAQKTRFPHEEACFLSILAFRPPSGPHY